MNALAHTSSENCLPIGTRLADFEITGILGEGGFGIVYIAFDHSLQRNVAIKEYMPGVLARRAADHSIQVSAERHQDTFNVGLNSFINEARILAQFDHPSLVKVYRFWEQHRTAYTAMKYYDGRTLKDIVTASPELVTEAWCRKILTQILEALEMLYTMRILHRDISPDNIIVQDDGDAVLLDFGSARQIIGDRTRGLTVILKPGYAPVEQYAGDASLEQGPYTDIYALSAVIYYAMTGEPPATSIARMVKDPIVPLATRGIDGFSTGFLAAIDSGLAVMANERPPTIDAFRALLGIASAGAPAMREPNPQRFVTLDHAPAVASSAAPVTGAPAAPTAPSAAPLPARAAGKATARPAWPAWASYVGTGALLLVIAAFGAKWLLDAPADILMPVTQSSAEADLPDASAAPPEPADPVIAPADLLPLPAAAPDVVAEPPAPVEPEPETGTATYRLAIRPWGTVYVDGKEAGVSPPLKKLALPAGSHTIRIVNPAFPEHSVEVTLGKGKSGTIEHHFKTNAK